MTSLPSSGPAGPAYRTGIRAACLVAALAAAPFVAERIPLSDTATAPSSDSTRFESGSSGPVTVARAAELEARARRGRARAGSSRPSWHAPPHALGPVIGVGYALNAALMIALPAPLLPPQGSGGGGEGPDISTSVMPGSGGEGEETSACSTEGQGEPGAPVGEGGPEGADCDSGPSSAYEESAEGGDPDMSTCSAVPEGESGAGDEAGSETCSTIGQVHHGAPSDPPSDEGGCSAIGDDTWHTPPTFTGSDQAACSTSGGENATTTCSVQPNLLSSTASAPETLGGGCSAGHIPAEDDRDVTVCSVSEGSEDGSTCSVTGDSNGESDVHCSAGNNALGKQSVCSIGDDGGENSFCSVKTPDMGHTDSQCSTWESSGVGGGPPSGEASCSVIGDGAGKCSIMAVGPISSDGFCSSVVDLDPAVAEGTCSVDPLGDGQGEGQCSSFLSDGEVWTDNLDPKGNCAPQLANEPTPPWSGTGPGTPPATGPLTPLPTPPPFPGSDGGSSGTDGG